MLNPPVPDYIQKAKDPGVYPGRDVLSVDDWVERYLDNGAYLEDWEDCTARSRRDLGICIAELILCWEIREGRAQGS